MVPSTKHIRESIDYLLGVDPVERWPDDLCFSPSPEDYGLACASTLEKIADANVEALAALIHAALKHDDERVRCACAESAGKIEPALGKALFYLQSYDTSDHVRDNAFESLWHIDTNDLTLARQTCDRLLKDEDEWVRDTAKRYKTGDNGNAVVYDGPRGGRYVIDKNGERQYLKQ